MQQDSRSLFIKCLITCFSVLIEIYGWIYSNIYIYIYIFVWKLDIYILICLEPFTFNLIPKDFNQVSREEESAQQVPSTQIFCDFMKSVFVYLCLIVWNLLLLLIWKSLSRKLLHLMFTETGTSHTLLSNRTWNSLPSLGKISFLYLLRHIFFWNPNFFVFTHVK